MHKIARFLRHALLLAAAVSMPTFAERERPLAQLPAQSTDAARVIVGYRADAPLAREHPVQRGESRVRVAAAYQRRADVMGQRVGFALRAGRAVGDRAHVVSARGIGSAALAARLAQDADVEYAVVDQRRRALAVTDPLFSAGPASGRGPDVGQWYLRAPTDLFRSAANVEAAWNAGTNGTNGADGRGIVVAVVDTGVWYDHVDLQGQLLAGYDFITDRRRERWGARDSDAADPVTGVTARTVRGTAPRWPGSSPRPRTTASAWPASRMAPVLPVRVLGKCGGYDSDIIAGMRWATGIDQAGLKGSATPARVLNLSLGGAAGEACPRVYLDAIPAITAKGAVIVAAAGNSAGRAVGAPANCPGVIAVAGLRHAGSKVGFSDLGPEIGIAAPGGNCVNIGEGEPCLYPILTTPTACAVRTPADRSTRMSTSVSAPAMQRRSSRHGGADAVSAAAAHAGWGDQHDQAHGAGLPTIGEQWAGRSDPGGPMPRA
jgi:serine protease